MTTGGASGGASESSSTSDSAALGSPSGTSSRSASGIPEASSASNQRIPSLRVRCKLRGSRRWYLYGCGCAQGLVRRPWGFSSVRWEDIEDIGTAGTDSTVQQAQGTSQTHFLSLARLVVDLYRGPPLRTDYELDRRLEAAESLSDAERLCNHASQVRNTALDNLRRLRLDHADAARQLVATNIALEQGSQAVAALEQRCRRLVKSLADTHKVIHQDRGNFKAGIATYWAQLHQLREYLERSDRPSSDPSNAVAKRQIEIRESRETPNKKPGKGGRSGLDCAGSDFQKVATNDQATEASQIRWDLVSKDSKRRQLKKCTGLIIQATNGAQIRQDRQANVDRAPSRPTNRLGDKKINA
ncbi:unnamed protein product [Phytophthora fragariaefolia]|uniref:Unnamed protein product n=1 Tax=Phytophthora fragariaefolia TaxID=1490495 RepID=A0A9W6YC58_9STRA|nr:unnamed protein product [Phytophthora fragariaefolia]